MTFICIYHGVLIYILMNYSQDVPVTDSSEYYRHHCVVLFDSKSSECTETQQAPSKITSSNFWNKTTKILVTTSLRSKPSNCYNQLSCHDVIDNHFVSNDFCGYLVVFSVLEDMTKWPILKDILHVTAFRCNRLLLS